MKGHVRNDYPPLSWPKGCASCKDINDFYKLCTKGTITPFNRLITISSWTDVDHSLGKILR